MMILFYGNISIKDNIHPTQDMMLATLVLCIVMDKEIKVSRDIFLIIKNKITYEVLLAFCFPTLFWLLALENLPLMSL